MKNQKIYIVGIFGILIIVLTTLIHYNISTINKVTESVSVLIVHPYAVSNASNKALTIIHHFSHLEPLEDQSKDEILNTINEFELYLSTFDSLNNLINEGYLGPKQDLIRIRTHKDELALVLASFKVELDSENFSLARFYSEFYEQVDAIESSLSSISEFANSKTEEILVQTLLDRSSYLFRLRVYVLLVILIFVGVLVFIGYVVRQKTQLLEENQRLLEGAQKNTERIRLINKIFQYQAKNEQEFLDYALNQGIALTESKFGYFYFFDDETQEFILNSWSNGVMDECAIVDPKTRYSLHTTGIWREAVRQKKAFIINDFEKSHPKKKGYPKGHVSLKKYMTAPIYENNEVVAVVGVANKETDYTQDDLEQLQLLMNQIWNINKARLREIENERFVRAVTESPLSIVITDVEGKIEYVNEYFTQLTGYTQDEAIGQNPRVLKSGTQDKKFYKDLWDTIASGEIWKGEFQNKSKNGNLYWESATISPIKDDNGNIISYVAVKEDITIRKLLLKKISYNEKFKDSIFSSMKEGLIVQDKDFNTVVANKSACEIFEMSLEEIKRAGPWDDRWQALSLEGEEIPNENFPVIKVMTEGVTVDNFVMNLVMGDEKRKFLAISSRPIFNDHGEVIQAVNTFRDITELIESNQALSASEQKYRDLFEMSADPSMIIKDGIIVDVNDAVLELFGCYSDEQLIGKDALDLSPETQPDNISSSSHYFNVTKVLAKRGSHRFEWIHKKLNGVYFPAEVMLTQINENGNTFTHVVLRDISERKAQEQIILDQLKEKDVLLAEIHHRVKNNMAVISGLIQLEVFKSNNEKVNEVLNATVNKIKSIGTIHNYVYASTDFRNVSMSNIIQLLVKNHTDELSSLKHIDINVELDLSEDIPINANQALPFGLLIDELILNFIRLIKTDKSTPLLKIQLYQLADEIHISVVAKCSCNEIKKCYADLDRTLIDLFIAQIGGSMRISNGDELKTDITFQLQEVNGIVAHQEI